MKKILCIVGLMMIIVAMKPPPEQGFWVIITRDNAPAMTVVRFYNERQVLVYEEHLDGVRLDGSNHRVQQRLNKSLRTALVAWEGNRKVMRDQGLVAMLFR
ncbi:MAG TPA: hypothetical protein VHE34_04825 [Puia sp.]|uniref:hypothetical protein n=1 Tax=Puia sp. TaxID=2045100 RepID=UPI002C3EB9DC|nr:hypothetical protein [Puia sp.]HVU94522.1 hypothetical protein [Puia sp.]